MKKIFLLVCISINFFSSAFSQNTFDSSLNEVSVDIAGKLSQKNKKRIVVLYITDINKTQTVAGKYMADVISVNIVNDLGNFEVFDRETLSGIVEAKKMIAEGYIDANKAKELGRILAVDAIVIGNYTVLTTTLKLTLKALDVNSGFVIAATMKDLPITTDAGSLLGIAVGNVDNNVNRGFNNRPLNSSESYNNPETVNKECEKNNKGDYCFTNSSNQTFYVYIDDSNRSNTFEAILESGQTQCFYNIPAKSYNYEIADKPGVYYRHTSILKRGQILVEKCKSKTFIIR
jgi:hypothetical protein